MRKTIFTLIFLGCAFRSKASENWNHRISVFFTNAWHGTDTITLEGETLIALCDCGHIIAYNKELKYVKSYKPFVKKLKIPAYKVDSVNSNDQRKRCILNKNFSFSERNPFCIARLILFGSTIAAGLGIYFYNRTLGKKEEKG